MWNGFRSEDFIFCDRDATIIYPATQGNGKLILKTEYLDAFPSFEIEMLKRGYTLCFLSHPTRWAPDSETHIMANFILHVSSKLHMTGKCIVAGMSCGGLQAVQLAELYPHLVSALYIDAPVLNILSMAGLGQCTCSFLQDFWDELVETYGFTRSTIVTFRKSPIDNMQPLIENNIPIIMVYGDVDDVVLYEENGRVLESYYKEHGGNIRVIRKPMCGHHPHGLEDPTPIISFLETYSLS